MINSLEVCVVLEVKNKALVKKFYTLKKTAAAFHSITFFL